LSVTNNDQLILVDPVDDEDVEDSSTDWSSKRLTMCDLKKKECYSLILIESIITLHWLWQIFLMWSQINFLLSIRLTGGWQIDFKVSGHFWMPRKYFRKLKLKLKLKFQNSENRSRQFLTEK
jgi:hypothetical protein